MNEHLAGLHNCKTQDTIGRPRQWFESQWAVLERYVQAKVEPLLAFIVQTETQRDKQIK